MRIQAQHVPACCLMAAFACGLDHHALAQQPTMAPLPASSVMARGVGDGWQSQGGVVGPWWTGSGAGVQPPAADGGFWFGFPGLGFGGSQGSTRSLGSIGSTVTSTPGAAGMMSSSRLTPFVTGVIPVVGSGHPAAATWADGEQTLLPSTRVAPPQRAKLVVPPPAAAAPIRPSTPASRARARRFVAAGDGHLLGGKDGPTAARAALDDYRSAGRFAQDDCDILIRQAIIHAALGQADATERVIARAVQLDGRLAAPVALTSAADASQVAPSPAPVPAVAARGESLLRELAASGDIPLAADAPARAVLDWLEAAWRGHWSAAAKRPAGEP